MKLLYKNECGNIVNNKSNWEIYKFTPSIRKMFLEGERKSLKLLMVRLLFLLMCKGNVNIFYVLDDNEDLMHTSYLLPKCYKFPYMKEGEYCIGPCLTYPQYRGKGIYPQVLKYILQYVNYSTVYMVVDEKNIASIKGIEKAGLTHCGYIKKTKILKRYYYKGM